MIIKSTLANKYSPDDNATTNYIGHTTIINYFLLSLE